MVHNIILALGDPDFSVESWNTSHSKEVENRNSNHTGKGITQKSREAAQSFCNMLQRYYFKQIKDFFYELQYPRLN